MRLWWGKGGAKYAPGWFVLGGGCEVGDSRETGGSLFLDCENKREKLLLSNQNTGNFPQRRSRQGTFPLLFFRFVLRGFYFKFQPILCEHWVLHTNTSVPRLDGHQQHLPFPRQCAYLNAF